MALGKEEIEHRFGFHKATVEGENATLPRHRDVRVKFREFAEYLDIMVTDGRAKSVMMTELETASMWAHKAIAEEAPLIGEAVPGDEPMLMPEPDPAHEEDPENDPAEVPVDEDSQPLGHVTDIAD